MKPATAAKKLGVHPDATPDEFRAGWSRATSSDALQADPPEWLRELRRNGPHPRQVVADRLGVSISGLASCRDHRALTTAQIAALKEEQPEWLRRERNTGPRRSARRPTAGRAVREASRRSGRG